MQFLFIIYTIVSIDKQGKYVDITQIKRRGKYVTLYIV